MRITDIAVHVLRQDKIQLIGDGSQDTVVVIVNTDEGIYGVGEADSSPYIVRQIIQSPSSHLTCRGLGEIVIGEDPLNTSVIWDKMYAGSYYYGRRGAGIQAMSAIDIAIWDIVGKKLGLPIHKLLGGCFHEKIPAYCSVLMPETADEIKKIVDTYMPLGYKGIKFGWGALGWDDKQDVRLVKAARKAMGDGPKLMIDIAKRWRDVKSAIRLCKEFENYDVFWVEEPFIPERIDCFKRLCGSVDMRITSGEELTNIEEFKELMDCGIDVIQPDASRCGGITANKKLIDLAGLYGTKVIQHAFKTGILMSASLHLIAANPGATFLEYCNQETILSKNLIKNHFVPDENGYVSIPTAPGLGIEVDMDVLKKYSVRI